MLFRANQSANTYFADKNICFIEMSSEHFWGFAGDGLDLDTNFFALSSRLHFFVIRFDTRHDANVQELEE